MRLIILFTILIAATSALAFAPDPSLTRNFSLGTKSYRCYSTVNKTEARCKTTTAAGVATTSKFFLNGDETTLFPSSDETIDNTRRSITSVCQRAYSTATPVSSYCWGR